MNYAPVALVIEQHLSTHLLDSLTLRCVLSVPPLVNYVHCPIKRQNTFFKKLPFPFRWNKHPHFMLITFPLYYGFKKKKSNMTKDLTLAFVSFGFRLAVSFWALPVFPVTLNLVMVSLSRLSSLATWSCFAAQAVISSRDLHQTKICIRIHRHWASAITMSQSDRFN